MVGLDNFWLNRGFNFYKRRVAGCIRQVLATITTFVGIFINLLNVQQEWLFTTVHIYSFIGF